VSNLPLILPIADKVSVLVTQVWPSQRKGESANKRWRQRCWWGGFCQCECCACYFYVSERYAQSGRSSSLIICSFSPLWIICRRFKIATNCWCKFYQMFFSKMLKAFFFRNIVGECNFIPGGQNWYTRQQDSWNNQKHSKLSQHVCYYYGVLCSSEPWNTWNCISKLLSCFGAFACFCAICISWILVRIQCSWSTKDGWIFATTHHG